MAPKPELSTQPDILAAASQSSSGTLSADSPSVRKSSGGQLKAYHAPWETVPSHVIDLVNGRSAYGQKSIDELWSYVSSPTHLLSWRTEFAGDLERQGVAISRLSQIMAMECTRVLKLEDDQALGSEYTLASFIDPTKMVAVFNEARDLLPHFKMLMASEDQKRNSARIDCRSRLSTRLPIVKRISLSPHRKLFEVKHSVVCSR